MTAIEKTLLLLISHSCNLNCNYCYEWYKDSRMMTWKEALKILETEFLHNTEHIESIDLLGGEPLRNFPVFQKICVWVWEYAPSTKVFSRTNGTLLTPDMKEWLSANRHRLTIGLSLDGTPEMNMMNRGFKNSDLDFFLNNWPDQPIKVTLFPNSIEHLYNSITYLYAKGAQVHAGLAQGVKWDFDSCVILGKQLELLNDYYHKHPDISPVEPLYDLNFHKAFWIMPEDEYEAPCWENANIHAYDCDGEVLPCHMFSSIVQGKQKRSTILSDVSSVTSTYVCDECRECPILWSCKNCMAMNYQQTGDFSSNIHRQLSCEAQKVSAQASASYIVQKFNTASPDSVTATERECIKNAIRYLKLRHSDNYGRNY